jgi:hypothetical protein
MDTERLMRLEENVTTIREALSRNNTILERNTDLLAEHIRRTELLEKQVNGISVEARLVRWAAAAGAIIISLIQIIQTIHGG